LCTKNVPTEFSSRQVEQEMIEVNTFKSIRYLCFNKDEFSFGERFPGHSSCKSYFSFFGQRAEWCDTSGTFFRPEARNLNRHLQTKASKYEENGAKWLNVVYFLLQCEKPNCFTSYVYHGFFSRDVKESFKTLSEFLGLEK